MRRRSSRIPLTSGVASKPTRYFFGFQVAKLDRNDEEGNDWQRQRRRKGQSTPGGGNPPVAALPIGGPVQANRLCVTQ